MFSMFDPKDPNSAQQYRRMAAPYLDQQIRSVINMIWVGLPPERQNVGEVEKEFQRIAARAFSNLAEDIAAIGLPSDPRNDSNT